MKYPVKTNKIKLKLCSAGMDTNSALLDLISADIIGGH